MLRRYRGLFNNGFGVKNRTTAYEPFKLVLNFRDAPEGMLRDETIFPEILNGTDALLVVNAIPVESIYAG